MMHDCFLFNRPQGDGPAIILGWWGYTFPLGVYTVATFKLGTTLQLGFFGMVGTVLTIALAAMWLLVGVKTVAGGWRGNLFVSPCIATPN